MDRTVRDLGFLRWKQDSAWMESMSGKRWDSMVNTENKRFLDSIHADHEDIVMKAAEFKNAQNKIVFRYENILITYISSFEIQWCYENDTSKTYTSTHVFVYKNKVYHIYDVGHGIQKYRLDCLDGHKVLWSKINVGTNVFVYDGYCYFLKCVNKLWYNECVCVNANSGKEEVSLYQEKNNRYNLNLVLGDNDTLFLIRENSGLQNLYVIEKGAITYKNEVLQYYIPIGRHRGKLCYLYSNGTIWKSSGFVLKKQFSNEVFYASLENNVIILIENGLRKIYNFDFKLLQSYYGNLIYNKFISNHFDTYYIDTAGAGIVQYNSFKSNSCIRNYGTVKRYIVNSVPLIVVIPFCKITGLMCVAYGGYGLPTSMSTNRWKPYIQAGWMIAFICVRGSGDVSKAWAQSARTYNKVRGFEDMEDSIKFLQSKYKISAKNTCIYGRSAGGYLVGGLVSRNYTGTLFKMVYTEVPYVDVLRTTSNQNLPLTALEYDEFGKPDDGIWEFRTIMNMSPVDSIDYNKPPDMFVLIRTSENDSQVYPYESYKWLYALRGVNKNDFRKLVYCSRKQGHFISGDENYLSFSQDFFLLNSFREHEQER